MVSFSQEKARLVLIVQVSTLLVDEFRAFLKRRGGTSVEAGSSCRHFISSNAIWFDPVAILINLVYLQL